MAATAEKTDETPLSNTEAATVVIAEYATDRELTFLATAHHIYGAMIKPGQGGTVVSASGCTEEELAKALTRCGFSPKE